MSRLPLLFVNNSTETFTATRSGAICTVLHEVSLASIKDGWCPSIITQPAAVPSYGDVPIIFVQSPRVPKHPWTRLVMRTQRKISGYRHFRHGEYIRRVVAAIRLKGFSGCPKIVSNDPELAVELGQSFPNSEVILWFHNQLACKDRFRRRLANSGARCIAVSNFTARWVEHYYGLPANSVPTVYNGVDAWHFSPASNAPPGPPVVNFLGRSCPEKGPDILLEAALLLAKKGLKFRLQLLGSTHWGHFRPNPYEHDLGKLVGKLEMLGIPVRRPGHIGRAALPDELRQAHIHVFTSRWDEPFGMATLEGMACGLATAASKTGGTPEVVGDAGLLFERENAGQLAEQLQRLITNEDLRRDYSARARQRALGFTWTRTWTALLAVLGGRLEGQEVGARHA